MKFWQYLVCFVLIVSGVFCGIELFKIVNAESYINGSINIENQFSVESFNYSNTSVVLYHDLYDETDTYSYTIDLLKVEDFNGNKNEYQVLINGYILLENDINAGSIFSIMYLDFYNTEGDILCSSSLNISIVFLSNKTTLTLSTEGVESANFLEQYFEDNGIRLLVNELV